MTMAYAEELPPRNFNITSYPHPIHPLLHASSFSWYISSHFISSLLSDHIISYQLIISHPRPKGNQTQSSRQAKVMINY